MKYTLLGLAALVSTPASAAGVEMNVENFWRHQNGAIEIVIKFTNNTNRTVSFVSASCALLDGDMKAVTTQNVISQNIAPGGNAYGKNYVLNPGKSEKAECRIEAIDY